MQPGRGGIGSRSTAGVATRLSRRAFGCGLVSGLSGRPNDGAQSRNFSARYISCPPERNRAEAPASSCLRLAGMTVIAAERTGRRCYGIELDPGYVDTIIRRWQALTGGSARHAASGRNFADLTREAEAANAV